VGRTTELRVERRPFYEPEEILEDVRRRLAGGGAASKRVDFLTFVPDGEPTVHEGHRFYVRRFTKGHRSAT